MRCLESEEILISLLSFLLLISFCGRIRKIINIMIKWNNYAHIK